MTHLATELQRARETSRARLHGTDLSEPANAAGTRRVQDILTHIAAWEREAALSVAASRTGGVHTLPLPIDLDGQNEVFHEASVALTATEALEAWESARRELIEAIDSVAPTHELTCPWGKVETAGHVVADMIGHENEHMEKLQAFQRRR